MIEAGAKLDDRDKHGWTPLMAAARHNLNPEVIADLLMAVANPKLKSNGGKTAFGFAKDNKKVKGTNVYWELKKATF